MCGAPHAQPEVWRLSADDLYWGEVDGAREQSPGEKPLDGPHVFDRVCEMMTDGIKYQFPSHEEVDLYGILLERLDIARQLETRP